jgi:hypothetical protein
LKKAFLQAITTRGRQHIIANGGFDFNCFSYKIDEMPLASVQKTPFSMLNGEMIIVYQDRLGTNMRKVEGGRVFSAGLRRNMCQQGAEYGKKTALFEPFIYKMHYFAKTGSGQT